MKTAVEYLANVLSQSGPITEDDFKSLVEQAKEMEKEQKIKFAENCLDKALDLDIRTAFSNVEHYYNTTFKEGSE